jgi:Flp pilus assembly protein TadD
MKLIPTPATGSKFAITVLAASACLILIPSASRAHDASMTPYAQILLGQDCMHDHDWSDAVYHFRLAVAMQYRNSEAHADLGYAYLNRADIERARWQFEEALRIRTNYPAAKKGLILTYQDENNRDAYLQQLRDTVTANPHDADAVASVAEELFDRGRVDEATQEANAALQMSPSLGHAHCVLGHIALSQGDDDSAVKELQAAIKADRNDDDAWGALGDIAVTRSDYHTAIDDYKHSVAAFPEHRVWHEKLADAYAKSGDTRSADHEQSLIAGLTEPLPEVISAQPTNTGTPQP